MSDTDGPLVIAVDSSTTSTKAIIVNSGGKVLAVGKGEISMLTPRKDHYEHNPADWWRSTDEAIGQAVSQLSDADKARIEALCITPQRQSFALLDADGHALRPGILWLDSRAVEQVQQYGTEHVHVLSGMIPDVTPSIYKIAWLHKYEPDVLARASKVAGVHGYLVHALTGEWVDSAATADSLGLFDMAHLTWADELLNIAGVSRDQMLDLVMPGDIIAPVSPAISRGWGLKQTIPVVAGCGDGQAAGLGAGAVDPDVAYLNMGTGIVAGLDSPTYKHGMVYRTDAGGIPGHYVLETIQNSGAYLAGWFREKLGNPALGGRPDPELDAAAAKVPPGSDGLLTMPYWNAVQSPHWDPLAHGAMVGFAGSHGRPEMYRSVLEGLCFETARNLRGLEADTGVRIQQVRIMGGGQRSPLWRQIMTDCIGVPLTACEEEEISALGAATMAMATTGVHGDNDIATSAKAMARTGDVSDPNPQMHDRYMEISAIQGDLYDQLKTTFARLSKLGVVAPD